MPPNTQMDDLLTWLRDHVGKMPPIHTDPKTGERFLWWHEVLPLLGPSMRTEAGQPTHAEVEADRLRVQLWQQPGAQEVVRKDLYAGRVRRKDHYPRHKQPRYQAKLGKWQTRLLVWLYEWDEDFQGRANDLWPRDISVQMRLKHVVGHGILWRPRLSLDKRGSPGPPRCVPRSPAPCINWSGGA